ncbi:MAG: hypothetical protein CMJ83_22525 [Planctomycetes bacterium]|nr:hypothetical protein [Planctomycetota bacterium]
MRYLLLMCSDEKAEAGAPAEMMAGIVGEYVAVTTEMEEKGVCQDSNRLRPTTEATTLRMNDDGAVQIMDGPFAETKEQMGGYYLIDVKDLDEAIAWAKRFPAVTHGGSIEIRPVWEMEDYETA